MTCPALVDPPLAVRWTDASLSVTTLGSALMVDARAQLTGPATVSTAPPGAPPGPTWYEWTVDALAGTVAFGLTAGSATLLGTDLGNFLYVSDGRIVYNGAVLRAAPVIAVGDTVGLYLDAEAQAMAFALNGKPV